MSQRDWLMILSGFVLGFFLFLFYTQREIDKKMVEDIFQTQSDRVILEMRHLRNIPEGLPVDKMDIRHDY